MPPLPPLNAVRVFEAAARLENFSRAAEELAMTQAGVSYQIKLLEERIGAALFIRRGRGIELTALGRRIAPRVSEAFATMGEAFAAVAAENESVLVITTSRSFATNWLAGRLGAFNLTRPGLAVRLHVSDELVDLASGEYDVAIRGIIDPEPGHDSRFLLRQMVTPMASPAFLERHPIACPADLLAVPRLSPDDEWWQLWFDLFDDPALCCARGSGLRFDSQVLDGQAAIAGHGAAMIFPFMFREAIAAGQLIQLFPRFASELREFWVVVPEHKRRLAKVRAFREWLEAEIRASVGDDPLGMLVPR
jgi:LysR family glycine cleavage system transcriptional activator